MKELSVKRMRGGAALPRRATEGSAGYDLCACLEGPLLLRARSRELVPTGIAIGLDNPGTAGFVFGRSGLGTKAGICPSNGVGVIDSDYRGEIFVGLANHSDTDYTIQPGERIAQLVILPVLTPEIVDTGELSETERGSGGFGSTGR